MENQLAVVVEKLGADGINAFYVYLVLEYLTIWLMLGLLTWGAHSVWQRLKNEM